MQQFQQSHQLNQVQNRMHLLKKAKNSCLQADSRGRIFDYRGAVSAYDKSIEASGAASLPQLQGLATALVADKRPAEAIRRLQAVEGAVGSEGAIGAVELELLIGKVYSQWERHFSSALAVYDGLIEKFPDDFRYGSDMCYH